ncbi:MAG: hypothetical protein JWR21_93 [Herminiimonas sp.]|nr:hypothetical protein [Herminiimonas sp.]
MILTKEERAAIGSIGDGRVKSVPRRVVAQLFVLKLVRHDGEGFVLTDAGRSLWSEGTN